MKNIAHSRERLAAPFRLDEESIASLKMTRTGTRQTTSGSYKDSRPSSLTSLIFCPLNVVEQGVNLCRIRTDGVQVHDAPRLDGGRLGGR